MNKPQGYIIGGVYYRSQQAIIERAKLLIHTAVLNQPLAGEAHAFVEDLLHKHERADEKIGAGIQHFEVRRGAMNSRCLWVIRTDGSETDFSYKLCIRPATPLGNFTAAARRAVAIQMIAFRDAWFEQYAGPDGKVTCSITGERYSKAEVDVDHIAPQTFASILHAYIEERGIDLTHICYVQGDGVMLAMFADSKLTQDFARYHEARARLRVISQIANRIILPQQQRMLYER